MFGVTEEVKVGVKSQVVIPEKIRDAAKIGPGATMEDMAGKMFIQMIMRFK